MTPEQKLLLEMASEHSRLAVARLDEVNIPFALSHLREAQRALELFKAAAVASAPRAIEVETKAAP